MKISTKGRYALRMMLYLAENEKEGYLSIRDIAGGIHVNIKYLEQIANQIGKAGLVHVTRGSSGGYRLCRKPEEYTVLEIIETVEGSVAPTSCLETPENYCEYSGECPTLPLWTELYDVIRNYLESKTLKDIMNDNG